MASARVWCHAVAIRTALTLWYTFPIGFVNISLTAQARIWGYTVGIFTRLLAFGDASVVVLECVARKAGASVGCGAAGVDAGLVTDREAAEGGGVVVVSVWA